MEKEEIVDFGKKALEKIDNPCLKCGYYICRCEEEEAEEAYATYEISKY